MTTKRTLATLATSALLGLSLTACGGSDSGSDAAADAPDDASTSDFCEAFAGLLTVKPDATPEEQVDAVHGVADDLEKVGTPSDISDDERDGFSIFVAALQGIDEDNIDDLIKSDDPEDIGLSGDDADKADAFADYAGKTCQDQLLGDLPTDLPTDDAS